MVYTADMPLTYAEAGVDLEAADRIVDLIQAAMRRTHGPRVLGRHGGFAGMFRLDYNEKLFQKNYREPVLVACADGVGTKVKLAAELGAERTLVVSDPGIMAAGHTDRGCAALNKSGIDHRIFSDIQENPTTVHVDHGVEVAKSYGPDLIIGLGGGSSMDCAKGINFLYSGGGRMQDYWGIGKATKPMLPMIALSFIRFMCSTSITLKLPVAVMNMSAVSMTSSSGLTS